MSSTDDAPEAATPDTAPGDQAPSEQAWRVTSLWECYEGEARVNLLRLVGIAVFYGIHLLARYVLGVEGITDQFHQAMTAIAVGWVFLALGVHLSLVRRLFPAWLRYLSTAGDFLLLSLVLLIGDGPGSPMVVVLFLALAASALRFDRILVICATTCAAAAYVAAVGNAHWWRPELQVHRQEQITVVAALVVMGLILGQIVRRVRPLAEEYAQRLAAPGEETCA